MTTQQTIKLVIVLAFVGFSVISWIVKQLQEQAKKKRIRDEIERRELEVLRTGREADASPLPPASTSAPAPASSRRRLEDVLRERIERQAGGTGLPVPIPSPPPRSTPNPRPSPQPRAAADDARRPKRKQRGQKAQAIPGSPLAPSATTVVVTSRTDTRAAPRPKASPAPQPGTLPGANLPTWQRAIVLSELLGPPLSARPGSP